MDGSSGTEDLKHAVSAPVLSCCISYFCSGREAIDSRAACRAAAAGAVHVADGSSARVLAHLQSVSAAAGQLHSRRAGGGNRL